MSNSVFSGHRRRLTIASIVGLASLLQGCLSYNESGTLNSNGSGRVAIAFGISGENTDAEKIRDVRYAVKHLKGVRWMADIDSTSEGRRWLGATLEFDSLAALRPLNTILPMEYLFGNMRLTETDSGIVFRRSVKLPSGSSADGDFMKIEWEVPRRILSTDRRARRDSGSTIARWNLPVDGQSGEWAGLEVRWEKSIVPTLPVYHWERPRGKMEWAMLGIAGATFLLSLVAAVVARGRVRAVRQKMTSNDRDKRA